jgi:hypothetical protein
MEQPGSRHSKPAALKISQAFALGLFLDQARARHHQRQLDVGSHCAQLLDHGGGRAHVLDAAVGARADEHLVDGDVVDRLARLEPM